MGDDSPRKFFRQVLFGTISEELNEPAQQDYEKTVPQKSAIYLFNLLIDDEGKRYATSLFMTGRWLSEHADFLSLQTIS